MEERSEGGTHELLVVSDEGGQSVDDVVQVLREKVRMQHEQIAQTIQRVYAST
jgi:hypothetical protein